MTETPVTDKDTLAGKTNERLENETPIWQEPHSQKPRRPPGYQVEDLDNLFEYHAPKGDQAGRYGKISEAAKEFARVVLENTPACADQTVTIRKIVEARMSANATIAINE